MAEDVFTAPDDSTDDWVDVRMTDPDAGKILATAASMQGLDPADVVPEE